MQKLFAKIDYITQSEPEQKKIFEFLFVTTGHGSENDHRNKKNLKKKTSRIKCTYLIILNLKKKVACFQVLNLPFLVLRFFSFSFNIFFLS